MIEIMPQLNEERTAKELGRIGTFKYIWSACTNCEQPRWVQKHHKKPRYGVCIACERKRRKGASGHGWQGGRVVTQAGYAVVYLNAEDKFYPMTRTGGYVMEHRLVMANKLDRCLRKDEIIHHLNGMRQDNRLENLVIVNKHNHQKETFIKQLQYRIRELEQLRLPI